MHEKIWEESVRKFNPPNGWITSCFGISEYWKPKITQEIINEIISIGESLGFSTSVVIEKQYWIILKPK